MYTGLGVQRIRERESVEEMIAVWIGMKGRKEIK